MPEIVLFETYIVDNPDEYRSWRDSNVTKAFVNSLLANLRTAQISLIRSSVVTQAEVAGHNHDQGTAITLETVLNLVDGKILPVSPEEDLTDDLPAF